jgi:hypothetical protein
VLVVVYNVADHGRASGWKRVGQIRDLIH